MDKQENKQQIDPDQLKLNELLVYAAIELGEARASRPSDHRFTFDLFRRAIQQQDYAAWMGVYQQYAPVVDTWVKQHPYGKLVAITEQKHALLIDAIIARFAQEMVPERWHTFKRLADIMIHLKVCVHTSLADSVRLLQKQDRIGELAEVFPQYAARDVWLLLQHIASEEKELAILYLSYVQALSPDEIVRHNSHLFPTTEAVYQVKVSLFNRLRANLAGLV